MRDAASVPAISTPSGAARVTAARAAAAPFPSKYTASWIVSRPWAGVAALVTAKSRQATTSRSRMHPGAMCLGQTRERPVAVHRVAEGRLRDTEDVEERHE